MYIGTDVLMSGGVANLILANAPAVRASAC